MALKVDGASASLSAALCAKEGGIRSELRGQVGKVLRQHDGDTAQNFVGWEMVDITFHFLVLSGPCTQAFQIGD